MTGLLILLKQYWKEIAIILAAVALVGGIYYQGYKNGNENCREEWAKEKAQQIEAINKRIDEIKDTSDTIANTQEVNNKKVNDNINIIISKLKNGKSSTVYTTIKDCKPNDAYVEAWNEISRKANSK